MPSQRSKRRTLITLIITVAAVLAMLGLVQAQGASKAKPTGWIAANPWHDEPTCSDYSMSSEPTGGSATARKTPAGCAGAAAKALAILPDRTRSRFFEIDSVQARSIKPQAWRY